MLPGFQFYKAKKCNNYPKAYELDINIYLSDFSVFLLDILKNTLPLTHQHFIIIITL
jgi:hypothetical protein